MPAKPNNPKKKENPRNSYSYSNSKSKSTGSISNSYSSSSSSPKQKGKEKPAPGKKENFESTYSNSDPYSNSKSSSSSPKPKPNGKPSRDKKDASDSTYSGSGSGSSSYSSSSPKAKANPKKKDTISSDASSYSNSYSEHSSSNSAKANVVSHTHPEKVQETAHPHLHPHPPHPVVVNPQGPMRGSKDQNHNTPNPHGPLRVSKDKDHPMPLPAGNKTPTQITTNAEVHYQTHQQPQNHCENYQPSCTHTQGLAYGNAQAGHPNQNLIEYTIDIQTHTGTGNPNHNGQPQPHQYKPNPQQNFQTKSGPQRYPLVPPEAQARVDNCLQQVRQQYFAPPKKHQYGSYQSNNPRENANIYKFSRPRSILKKRNTFQDRVTRKVPPPPLQPCNCGQGHYSECPMPRRGPSKRRIKSKPHPFAPKRRFNPINFNRNRSRTPNPVQCPCNDNCQPQRLVMNDNYQPERPPINQNYQPQRPPINQNYQPQRPPINQNYQPQRPPINQNYQPQRPPINQNYQPQHPPINQNYQPQHPPINQNYQPQRPPMDNCQPTHCPINHKNYCGCGQDECEFAKTLPLCPDVTYCANGSSCNEACGQQEGIQRPFQPSREVNPYHSEGQRKCRFSEDIQECCYSNGDKSSDKSSDDKNFSGKYHVAAYDFKICCGDDCEEHKGEKRHSHDSNDSKRHSHDSKRHSHSHKDNASSVAHHSCCCEHGVPFMNCCTPPPPPPTQETPTIIVNNTELCECEDKWARIERWKDEARRREKCRKRHELQRQQQEGLRRQREREENEKRHKESLRRAKEEDRRRLKEAHRWRKEQRQIEEERTRLEEERWLEELCDRQEQRRFIEEQECRREARRWHEEQLRERPTSRMAIPELEEMRRALAPIPQGQHEVFEYFCLEPKEPEKKETAESQAMALMGLTKEHGIHLQLSDRQQKRTTVQLRMGPPVVGNKMLSITSGDPCKKENKPSCGGNNCIIPQDIQNVMMNIQQMNNPLLRFNQTRPYWTSLQGNLAFPPGLGGTLTQYYCS